MKILHLSDTHGVHRRLKNLPEADIVVHSGDFCMVGEEHEALDFLNWFCDLPYKHKIFICGNHDICLHGGRVDGLDENVYHLDNSGIEIEGLKFYGVPLAPLDDCSSRQTRSYEAIPEDTDILITHAPAHGILDLDAGLTSELINYGSPELLERVQKIHPRAHLFGHIHRQHGMEWRHLAAGHSTLFSNGAIMNEDYSNFNTPNIIEILPAE